MSTSFDLRGRHVVIVGASSGLGLEVARGFAAQGCSVTLVAEVDAVFEAARALAEASGSHVAAQKCDITSREQVARLAATLADVDVLVNNAGTGAVTAVDDVSDATARIFERTIDVNLLGLYWVTQAIVPKMTSRGRIIFTTSIWAHTGAPQFSAYVASKHALVGIVQSLAAELGARGITVNAVSPGSLDTELNRTQMPRPFLDRLCGQMKLRPGLIPPAHLAGAYMFLASDSASEITGQVLAVDRGQSINW